MTSKVLIFDHLDPFGPKYAKISSLFSEVLYAFIFLLLC